MDLKEEQEQIVHGLQMGMGVGRTPAAMALHQTPAVTASVPWFGPLPAKKVKAWHAQLTLEMRNHLVVKILKTLCPSSAADLSAMDHQQLHQDLVSYAKRVEADVFNTADSNEAYYHLLAGKIYNIKKELEERKKQPQQHGKKQQQQQTQVKPSTAASGIAAENPTTTTVTEATAAAIPWFGFLPEKQTKAWHAQVTPEMRNHSVVKIFEALSLSPDMLSAIRQDRRLHRELVSYAKKVEADFFESADNTEDYDNLVAEKIGKIEMDVEEKEQRRREQQQHSVHGPPLVVVGSSSAIIAVKSTATAATTTTTVTHWLLSAPVQAKLVKAWHVEMTPEMRIQSAVNIVKAAWPSANLSDIHQNQRLQDIVSYAKNMEADFFDDEDSKEAYAHSLAKKIDTIQRELEEKKQRRLREQKK